MRARSLVDRPQCAGVERDVGLGGFAAVDAQASLSRLLARRVDGIFLSDFEQGEIGPDFFRHACLMGLEGMVSKHRESTYRGGRFRHWVKIKNRAHPVFSRVQDQF
jgi:bifunctional non-homologous end joining protein LigD